LTKFDIEKEKIASYSKKKLSNVNGTGSTYLLNRCDLEGDRHYTHTWAATFGYVVLFLKYKRDVKELSRNCQGIVKELSRNCQGIVTD
jgi:hypothetical protein